MRLLLVSFILGDSKFDFFPSRLPCGQPYKFRFEANPIWYSAIKFTKSHSAKCSLHKWAWLTRSIKVSSFELYKFRVPGEIKRSRDLRGGRWSWTLTFAQKRSWVGRWSWAEQVGRLLLRVFQVVRQQRCNGHCLCGSVQHSSWNSNCAVHRSLGNGEGTPP